MSSYFIDVDVETDAQTLADDAIVYLQTVWTGWEPNDGDLEVVQIEALAPMAANAAETAARVPAAVLRAYGTKLIGRPYALGSPATTTVTFNAGDAEGHVIDAGTELDIDNYAFTVDVETVIASGAASASGVAVSSADYTSDANGLTGESVTPVTSLAWLDSVVVESPTSGGTDPEDDVAYQDALSRDLLLQAKTLVTTRDFELWALSFAGVGRAYAVHTGDRAVTVVLTDADGEAVSQAIKDDITADFEQYRLVNTVVTLSDPTYTTIDVTYTVKALPGYDATDLTDRIDAMLTDLLSPANWGRPKFNETLGWVLDNTVRANLVIDRIGDVDGVNYVTSVALNGSGGSASGDDWLMAGTYALPRAGTMTGTIT